VNVRQLEPVTRINAFRFVISLYASTMAVLVSVLFVGAGWSYGYYGYKDKSSNEMLAVTLEFVFDVAMFLGFLAVAVLIWRRTIGAWSAVLMLGPALVVSWWLVQCRCLPSDALEFAAYALSGGGFVLLQQYRKRLPNFSSSGRA